MGGLPGGGTPGNEAEACTGPGPGSQAWSALQGLSRPFQGIQGSRDGCGRPAGDGRREPRAGPGLLALVGAQFLVLEARQLDLGVLVHGEADAAEALLGRPDLDLPGLDRGVRELDRERAADAAHL